MSTRRSRSRSPRKRSRSPRKRSSSPRTRSPRRNDEQESQCRMLHSVNVVNFLDNTCAFKPCQIAFRPTWINHWNDAVHRHSIHFQIALYYQKNETDGIKWILLDFLFDNNSRLKNYWKITNQLNSAQVTYVNDALPMSIKNIRGYVCAMVQRWLTDEDNNENFCAWMRAVLE